MIKTEDAIPKKELEELARAIECEVSKGTRDQGNFFYFFKKDKLTEEDLINLHKLDLDHVFVSKEEYDILKTTPIFQYMPWLTYHKSIKTSQNA